MNHLFFVSLSLLVIHASAKAEQCKLSPQYDAPKIVIDSKSNNPDCTKVDIGGATFPLGTARCRHVCVSIPGNTPVKRVEFITNPPGKQGMYESWYDDLEIYQQGATENVCKHYKNWSSGDDRAAWIRACW